MPSRIKKTGDIFKKVLTTKQSLEKAFKKMKELERKT
jgi:hypothetical protein